MLEIPSLKVVYEDETGVVYMLEGENEFTVHAEVIPTTDRKILLHYRDVIDSICENLRERGWSELKCWVQTDEQYRFANFFGFFGTGNEIELLGYSGSPIYELVRKLN